MMKIIGELWVIFVLTTCLSTVQKAYTAEPITQTVHYDDDEESISTGNNSPYPQIEEPKSSSYKNSYISPENNQYSAETIPLIHKKPQHRQEKLYGYYTGPEKYISVRPSRDSYEEGLTYPSKSQLSKDEGHDNGYKKPITRSKEISYGEPEELQYSHDSDHESSSHTAPARPYLPPAAPSSSSYPKPASHSGQYSVPVAPSAAHSSSYSKPATYSGAYPASAAHSGAYPAPAAHPESYHAPTAHSGEYQAPEVPSGAYSGEAKPPAAYPDQAKPSAQYPGAKRDPKLPLYFTMYEKRIVQDPLDKYGKGPWRYLTYGHGITYGSKEPGKVFEKGYGYIRALGRDHCELPKHLCPPTDEKPFEYDGRKEPYFGYRPH